MLDSSRKYSGHGLLGSGRGAFRNGRISARRDASIPLSLALVTLRASKLQIRARRLKEASLLDLFKLLLEIFKTRLLFIKTLAKLDVLCLSVHQLLPLGHQLRIHSLHICFTCLTLLISLTHLSTQPGELFETLLLFVLRLLDLLVEAVDPCSLRLQLLLK